MSYRMFLDDLRPAPPGTYGLVVCRSYQHAVDVMERDGCPYFVSFDHDLGEVDGKPALTGYDVAKWMIGRDIESGGRFFPDGFRWHVHSANPVGRINIEGLFMSYFSDFCKHADKPIGTYEDWQAQQGA